MVEMETAIGRFGGGDTVTCFEKINPKWGFVGWIANICTFGINMYYVVIGGWVLKYAITFITGANFGDDVTAFYNNFISSPVEPLIYTVIVLGITSGLLLFGITELVEKVTKIIMPALFVLLIFCGFYSCLSVEGAIGGLKYYLLPAPENFNVKVFADAATQVLFSVGIGWGIFTTLGINVPKENNLKSDALLVSICDTAAAITAGFVVIPAAYGAGVELTAGPKLLFVVMSGIFANLPGGRIIGSFFFIAVLFAVFSSLFTFFEIGMRTFEVKLKMGRKKAVAVSTIIIGIGNIFVSLGFGPLSWFTLPWPSFQGIAQYNLLDWFDCFTAYLLLPLGCILICLFVQFGWGWEGYEKELFMDGRDGKLSKFDKILTTWVVPAFMIIILLNVFGILQ